MKEGTLGLRAAENQHRASIEREFQKSFSHSSDSDVPLQNAQAAPAAQPTPGSHWDVALGRSHGKLDAPTSWVLLRAALSRQKNLFCSGSGPPSSALSQARLLINKNLFNYELTCYQKKKRKFSKQKRTCFFVKSGASS